MYVDCGPMLQFTVGVEMTRVRVRHQLVHLSGSEQGVTFHLEFVSMIPLCVGANVLQMHQLHQ